MLGANITLQIVPRSAARAKTSGMATTTGDGTKSREITERIARNIARLRNERGLDQISVAKKLGWSQSTYSNYERGDRLFQVDKLKEIADAFSVSIAELVEEQESIGQHQELRRLFDSIDEEDRLVILSLLRRFSAPDPGVFALQVMADALSASGLNATIRASQLIRLHREAGRIIEARLPGQSGLPDDPVGGDPKVN